MKYTRIKSPTLIFATLIPLVLVFTFLLFNGSMISGDSEKVKTSQWTSNIEEANFQSDILEKLTETLYKESKNNGRPEVLATLIFQISHTLMYTNEVPPQALTDLLRNLSLEHTDMMVRLSAYEAMLISLETEHKPSQSVPDLAIY